MKSTSPRDPAGEEVLALSALRDATVAFADAAGDSGQTLELALDLLIGATGADAGAVAVPGEIQGLPALLAQRSLDDAGPVSMTVLEAVLAGRAEQAAISEPPSSASVLDASITSVLCVPVRRQGRTLAAVYLDRRDRPSFDQAACALAESFAAMLALALDLTRRVEHTEQRAEEARAAAVHAQGFWRFGGLVTRSRPYAECLQLAERVAPSDSTVLLLGQTGVGKEHLARCIHAASRRSKGPFVVVNCAALPEPLLENELFGHERGAFTGAVEHRRGKFELAHSGTLLLDEIGELPLAMQPKLLRVLDRKRITRLGGGEEKPVDVRILAATNRDLPSAARSGRFREDLLYRLNVVTLRIPPLCERPEDIAALAEAFLEAEARQAGRKLRWDAPVLRRLTQHRWPGNVRELKNAVERLAVLADGPVLRLEELERHIFAAPEAASAGEAQPPERLERVEKQTRRLARQMARLSALLEDRPLVRQPARTSASAGQMPSAPLPTLRERMDSAARQAIAEALERAGSLGAAAQLLGVSRQSLWSHCKRLGLRKALVPGEGRELG